jgi:hypothetical protein
MDPHKVEPSMGPVFLKLIAETFSKCKDLLSFFSPMILNRKRKSRGVS